MNSVQSNKSSFQPRNLRDLLPELNCILTKGTVPLTSIKKPRTTVALTRTSEKHLKPLTIAELRANLLALKAPSPKRPATSNKKKWNASIKVDKRAKSINADGPKKHHPVRQLFNNQPQHNYVTSKPSASTTQFTKPEVKSKTSHMQGTNNDEVTETKNLVRISGVAKIPQTPAINKTPNPIKKRMTLANKENIPLRLSVKTKPQQTTMISKTNIVPNTPLTNDILSTSDTSFLQMEKQVQNIEKTPVANKELNQENNAENIPPSSTPFKEYRKVQEFFNHSNNVDNSAEYNDNTIMSFDNSFTSNKKSNVDDGIADLCNLLDKVSVTNTSLLNTDVKDLLEIKKSLEHNIEMLNIRIKKTCNTKESLQKSLQLVENLIKDKNPQIVNENNEALIEVKSVINIEKLIETSPVSSKTCSRLTLKSPTYKIPNKYSCLRKTVLKKLVPNVPVHVPSPETKEMAKKALHMYMEMKTNQQMHFLNTPCAEPKSVVPDTPAITSNNLLKQLDSIYKDDT